MMTRTAECHSVRYLLLAWLLMLTAGQVVFLTLHYTAGEHSRSQGEVTPQPTRENKENIKPQTKKKITEAGKMVTLEASEVDGQGRIEWRARNQEPTVFSLAAGGVVTLKDDAYYFLCLTVTLNKPAAAGGVTVSVKRNGHVILESRVHEAMLSTGAMVKVEDMMTSDTLVVTVTPRVDVDTSSPAKTNLGIICLPKPPPTAPPRREQGEK